MLIHTHVHIYYIHTHVHTRTYKSHTRSLRPTHLTCTSPCSATLPGMFTSSNGNTNCSACGDGKFQEEAGASFCDDARRNQYIRNNEEHECPVALNQDKEARCQAGVLMYKQKFWHDGLDLSNPIALEDNRLQYQYVDGQQLQRKSLFYECPDCDVDPHSGAITCPGGGSGVLCSLCREGYVSRNNACAECKATSRDWITHGCLLLLVVGVVVAVAVYKKGGFVGADNLRYRLQDRLSAKFKLTGRGYTHTYAHVHSHS